MSEIQRVIISFVFLALLCVGCFFGGYILSNRRAVEQLNNANQQIREQQQRYDELVKATDQRIRAAKEDILGKIKNNGAATAELRTIVEQIRKQKLNIQI